MEMASGAVFRTRPASVYSDDAHSRTVSAAFNAGKTPPVQDLHNALERSVLEHYPEVAQARADLLQAGAPFVRLSGTGPTLFAPFSELACAHRVQEQLRTQGYEVYLSRAIHPKAGHVAAY